MVVLSEAQLRTLRAVQRTGRIVPKQAASLKVLTANNLVVWDGRQFVLTEAGTRKVR